MPLRSRRRRQRSALLCPSGFSISVSQFPPRGMQKPQASPEVVCPSRGSSRFCFVCSEAPPISDAHPFRLCVFFHDSFITWNSLFTPGNGLCAGVCFCLALTGPPAVPPTRVHTRASTQSRLGAAAGTSWARPGKRLSSVPWTAPQQKTFLGGSLVEQRLGFGCSHRRGLGTPLREPTKKKFLAQNVSGADGEKV